jgi:hypothetical protein
LRAERRYTEAENSPESRWLRCDAFPEDDPRLVRAQVNYASLMEDQHRLTQPKKLPVHTLR